PPYSYLWSDPSGQTTDTATGLFAGKYYVTVTDAKGCSTIDSATVGQPTLVTATASADSVLCYGGNTGSAWATASGGTQPYTYAWSDPASQTTDTATGLIAGTYYVT